MKRLELVISMKALLENARAVRGRVPENVKICAVVKADAYGHGAAELSRALESERLADAFAVATPEEGRALREAGVKGEILVLGLTDADGAEESAGTGAGLWWILGLAAVALVVFTLAQTGGGKAMFQKMGRTFQEMTGGALGGKKQK